MSAKTAARLLAIAPGSRLTLPSVAGLPKAAHIFDQESILAINAALVTGRPLLLRGEPGTGKSQLARAAAVVLGRAFISHTVDARTEPRDLLYTVDDVARLAEAQVQGVLCGAVPAPDPTVLPDTEAAKKPPLTPSQRVREAIQIGAFVEPGPLWWAFNRASAEDPNSVPMHTHPVVVPPGAAGFAPEAGSVVLIDEIDKADASVPNGLLEALGHRRFAVPGGEVCLATDVPAPLVIITTNEERALPDAFLRRCWVLHILVPDDEPGLVEWLVARGRAHYDDDQMIDDGLMRKAAASLAAARSELPHDQARPATAEFLDLLGALAALRTAEGDASALLSELGKLVLDKHGVLQKRERERERARNRTAQK